MSSADEGGEPRRHPRVGGGQRLDGSAVEELALHGATLQDPSLRRVELVEPLVKQRLDRRRDRTSRRSPAIATISVRKSGLPPAPPTMPAPARGSRRASWIELYGCSPVSGSSPERYGPVGTAV